MTAHTPPTSRTDGTRRNPFAILMLAAILTGSGVLVGVRWHSVFQRWLPSSISGAARSAAADTRAGAGSAGDNQKQLWTCGMHPQVIQDHPGDCPICHMKLTPLVIGDSSSAGRPRDAHAGATVVIDPVIVQNMGVRTVVVSEEPLAQRVRATAVIVEPESARTDITLRVSGWIQKLYANTDGMAVRKGAPLFDLYSPDLQLPIDELVSARRARASTGTDALKGAGEGLIAAAESRLRALGLSASQIAHLDHAPAIITIESPVDGIVIEKASVYNGSYVATGQLILRLADRSTMWVEARVPESMLARVHPGQHATIRVDALAGPPVSGDVIFIHPNLDEMTRTALVRIIVPNPDGLLRQGMYAVADIDTGTTESVVVVPREAIIDSGESRLVFVRIGNGTFEPRRVTLGASGEGGMVQVVSGVETGETVVASGQFLLDSESRLREAIAKFLNQRDGSSGASPTPAPRSMPSVPGTDAKAPTESVDKVVTEYLAIAEPFGEEAPDTPPAKVDGLLSAIDALAQKAIGVDAPRLTASAREAVVAMKSRDTEKQRDLFKRASAAVIAIVDAMPPSDPVASGLYVANCPMAKADWLQRAETLANPYYAEDMKECGTIVRRVGQKPGSDHSSGAKRGTP